MLKKLFFVLFLTANLSFANMKNVLVVLAHPDDEICMAAGLYLLTQQAGHQINFLVLTRGEGGKSYTDLAQKYYKKNLKKAESKSQLAQIREGEMKESVKILGGNRLQFVGLSDFGYTKSLSETMEAWKLEKAFGEWAKIDFSPYDLIITLFPAGYDHGHHKATAKMVLDKIGAQKTPVLAVRIQDALNYEPEDLATFLGKQEKTILKPFLTLKREQYFGRKDRLGLQIPVNWVIAAHKSQGAAQRMMMRDKTEEYYVLSNNGKDPLDWFVRDLKVDPKRLLK